MVGGPAGNGLECDDRLIFNGAASRGALEQPQPKLQNIKRQAPIRGNRREVLLHMWLAPDSNAEGAEIIPEKHSKEP